MQYISSDTNIWLDFSTIGRLELPFNKEYVYLMYKDALRKEIISPPKLVDELEKCGLLSVELSTEEYFYADALGSKYKKLSHYDRTALAIAKKRGIPLLTGDNPLRQAAESEGVEVFGTIGLLDRLFEGDHISKDEYVFCLKELLVHEERRLPSGELKKRINALK